MTEYTNFYEMNLYPLQNGILKAIEKLSLPFYLTGGTALSRFYLQHRFSDDLDFFINEDPNFSTYTAAVISELTKMEDININKNNLIATPNYVSINITKDNIPLKIDFVNDIPVHFGDFRSYPLFNKVDSIVNILTNKITALIGRNEIKDVVDVWAIATNYSFDWKTILDLASQKEACIDTDYICGALNSASSTEITENICWSKTIDGNKIKSDLSKISNDIVKESPNSLCLIDSPDLFSIR